jgi:hypothetical protein
MSVEQPPGVFAVQCPRCKRYMLVEQTDRGKVVPCLLCKAPIRVGGTGLHGPNGGGAKP